MKKSETYTIIENWMSNWEKSLLNWSKFVRMKEPIFLFEEKSIKKLLGDSIAAIRLDDHAILVDMLKIQEWNLLDYSEEILSHEIGHHVYSPGNLTNYGKMVIRVRKVLKRLEYMTPMVTNLYEDLLINYRLKRFHKLKIDEVYQKINAKVEGQSNLWKFYMRIYELLWALPKGYLSRGEISDTMEADAGLGKDLILSYAEDFVHGSGRFAALCYVYLLEDSNSNSLEQASLFSDTKSISMDEIPPGLLENDPTEESDCIHPALELKEGKQSDGISDDSDSEENGNSKSAEVNPNSKGSNSQYREPFEFGQILRDMGLNINSKDIVIQYYKERAIPYLVPFPSAKNPVSKEPLIEGVDVWEIGSPMENINWFQTAIKSPIVIPGYTTVEDRFGLSEGSEPDREPIDLDIYIDCSGSMPNPGQNVSYLALAGTIISLSALRTGSKVQATLWSGPGVFRTTKGFISDEKKVLEIITGYIGGSTAFPIHIIRDTYSERKPSDRKVHILHISDDGITTMYDKDEKGNNGYDVMQMALDKSGGGGATMVLNLYSSPEKDPGLKKILEQGWDMSVIRNWTDLLEFARKFSNKNYTFEGS